MNDPRPAMISARPPDNRSSVANSWKTRTGIVGAEDADGARQADFFVRCDDRRQHHRGRGHQVVRPVMLAHAEHVEPDLVGELDFGHQLAHPLRGRGLQAPFDECIETQFHRASIHRYRFFEFGDRMGIGNREWG